METSLAIQHQLSKEKWGNFKEDIKNLEEMSKKIKNLLIIDYEAIFPEILLMSKNQFLSNIKKGVYSNLEDLYSNNVKSDTKLKSVIDDNLKIIEEKYETNYNLLKIEWNNFNENKNDKNYLCCYRKHCFNDTDYASHNCKENDSKFIVITINNNENNKNEFVICSNCQKVYKSSFILCKCFHCDTEYYSQKLPDNQSTDLFLATWKEYHCPQLINNKMSCIKCKSPFYLNMKTGMLNCSNKNCQFISKPKRILWTCNNCKNDFTSEAIVYNPLDVEIIQKAIKQTLLLKHRAHPNKMPCCRLNIFFTEFYHKKTCKGILYLGEINDELIIVCEKCHAINYYSRFIWTCPKCQTKFRTKKKERTQSNYSNHKSEFLSSDKSTSLKSNDKDDKNNNQIEKNKNEKEIDKKENKDNYNNKNKYLTINGNENENEERMEIKDKEDDVVKVIRKSSIKAVVTSPLRKRNRAYQSFRLKRPNKFDAESAKKFSCVSIDDNNNSKINSICDNENENQRKSMYFIKKFKSGITEFKIGEDEKEKINIEIETDKNEVKKNDKQEDKDEDNNNDLKEKNEHNEMHKSIGNNKNYKTIEEKSFFRNRFKFLKNKNENADNIDENDAKDNNKNEKEPQNKIKDINKAKNEPKLIRVNTTDENHLISKRRSVYMHNRLNFHNIDNKEQDTPDENKDKDNIDNKENEKEKEKENKYKKRGAFSRYLFFRGSDNKLGGSSKNNFLSENFLKRASLKMPDYSALRENYNKKEKNNNRKSSSSSASFSDKNDNDKEDSKEENINSSKNKEKVVNNNLIKNIKENSKKSTKVDSKESDKVSSKKEIEKKKENKEEVKEKYEEKEEEEDDFEEDEENTEGIEVDNKNNDESNNKSSTQFIPGISENLLSHITKRINHILNNTKIAQFNLEDYSIYRKLGEGSYGIIHCIIHEKTKEKFALKKIIAHSLKKISEFTKEFELVHICHHPNILKIYGLNINILDQSTYSLQVLMEKAERDWDKDIKRRLQERKYYTEDELVSIMKQLTSALLFMKEKLNITHRDIKPQNVLIFNNGVFKLADFGEAKEIKIKKNLNTLRGTELYMSPALYNGLKVNQDDVAHDPFKSDLFSLGFCLVYASTFNFNLLYEMRNINNDEIIKKKIREELKDNYSEKFIWILTKMVELDEKNRFDFKELADEIEKNYGK